MHIQDWQWLILGGIVLASIIQPELIPMLGGIGENGSGLLPILAGLGGSALGVQILLGYQW